MQVSVSDAKAQLTDLVRRAEAGEEVVLTRHGQAAVRLMPIRTKQTAQSRAALIDSVRHSAATTLAAGPSAERSQDFLYDEDGLPG